MITLQQDADGFVRMNRHYPASVRIRIAFNDGSTGEFSGQALNNAYDAALAEFRAKNGLDAKGFNRLRQAGPTRATEWTLFPCTPAWGSSRSSCPIPEPLLAKWSHPNCVGVPVGHLPLAVFAPVNLGGPEGEVCGHAVPVEGDALDTCGVGHVSNDVARLQLQLP